MIKWHIHWKYSSNLTTTKERKPAILSICRGRARSSPMIFFLLFVNTLHSRKNIAMHKDKSTKRKQ
ncbi:hypothetical protein EXN66_Car008614 [Channa argus]|uniref:Uncharacterized protein n=1 Tax=Channa argus TaxID=215402 RepID=A0A6G1PSH3_CHAAH|nr:hypothetical protein EXN66_Car008614 [Channa argus]